jgi:O-antigen ligase
MSFDTAAAKFDVLARLLVLPIALIGVLPWLIGAAPGPVAQMGAWLVSGFVLAGLLLFQSARTWPLSLLLAAVVSLGVAGLQYAGLAGHFSPWIAEAAPGEMLGNLRQRNQLASLLTLGSLSLFALTAASGVAKRWLLMACWAAAMLGLGNALSGSRTGLLQWAAVLLLAWAWRRSAGGAWRSLAAAAAVGYVFGVVLAPLFAQMLGHANAGLLSRAVDGNAFSRLALWGNVLELIAREPLLGHGWRSLAYAHYSSDFSGPRFLEMLDNAHNLPLHLAVELGLPVALAFCALVAWGIWQGKPWVESRPERQLAWGALLVIGIHSLVEYPLWYGPFFMTALISIGVLLFDSKLNFKENTRISGIDTADAAITLGARCFGIALLAFTAFVAFDYHRASQIYLSPEQRSGRYAAEPLAAAKQSVFFDAQAKFAELQITALSKESAPRVFELSSALVRWSPEPRIIEKLIESSVMMGLDDVAAFHLKCYARAYPAAYAAWKQQR